MATVVPFEGGAVVKCPKLTWKKCHTHKVCFFGSPFFAQSLRSGLYHHMLFMLSLQKGMRDQESSVPTRARTKHNCQELESKEKPAKQETSRHTGRKLQRLKKLDPDFGKAKMLYCNDRGLEQTLKQGWKYLPKTPYWQRNKMNKNGRAQGFAMLYFFDTFWTTAMCVVHLVLVAGLEVCPEAQWSQDRLADTFSWEGEWMTKASLSIEDSSMPSDVTDFAQWDDQIHSSTSWDDSMKGFSKNRVTKGDLNMFAWEHLNRGCFFSWKKTSFEGRSDSRANVHLSLSHANLCISAVLELGKNKTDWSRGTWVPWFCAALFMPRPLGFSFFFRPCSALRDPKPCFLGPPPGFSALIATWAKRQSTWLGVPRGPCFGLNSMLTCAQSKTSIFLFPSKYLSLFTAPGAVADASFTWELCWRWVNQRPTSQRVSKSSKMATLNFGDFPATTKKHRGEFIWRFPLTRLTCV